MSCHELRLHLTHVIQTLKLNQVRPTLTRSCLHSWNLCFGVRAFLTFTVHNFFYNTFFWLTKLFNVFPQKPMAFWSLKDLLGKKFEIHHNFTGTNKRSKALSPEMTRRFTGKSIQSLVLAVAKDLRAKGRSFRGCGKPLSKHKSDPTLF